MWWSKKKPELSPEQKGEVLKKVEKKIEDGKPLSTLIAEAIGPDEDAKSDNVMALLESIRSYGTPKGTIDVSGWWKTADTPTRVEALTTTIGWVTSR